MEDGARSKCIKLAVINGFDDRSEGDPETCYLKLFIDKCLQIHNDRFVKPAKGLRGQMDVPNLELHLLGEPDMIQFNIKDFEMALLEFSTQSLNFGEGKCMCNPGF